MDTDKESRLACLWHKIQTQLFLSQDANLCQYLGVSCRSLTNHGSIPIQNLITNQFLKQNSYQYVVEIIYRYFQDMHTFMRVSAGLPM